MRRPSQPGLGCPRSFWVMSLTCCGTSGPNTLHFWTLEMNKDKLSAPGLGLGGRLGSGLVCSADGPRHIGGGGGGRPQELEGSCGVAKTRWLWGLSEQGPSFLLTQLLPKRGPEPARIWKGETWAIQRGPERMAQKPGLGAQPIQDQDPTVCWGWGSRTRTGTGGLTRE